MGESFMDRHEGSVSVGNWILTFIITAIPLIGLIMILVWAFGNSVNRSKSNYCKAVLLMWIIAAILTIVITAATGVSLFSIVEELGV